MRKTYIIISCILNLMVFSNLKAIDNDFHPWQIIGEMPVPVSGGEAVVYNDKIYIIGGYSEQMDSVVSTIQEFDPKTMTWQQPAILNTKRHNFITGIHQNKIIAAGGIRKDSTRMDFLEVWNFTNGPKFSDENTCFNRLYVTGSIYNDWLCLIGGQSAREIPDNNLNYISIYDLGQHQIIYEDTTYKNQLPYQQMSILYEDNIYIFGGVYLGISKNIYKFDLNSFDLVEVYPTLKIPRAGGKAVYDDYNKTVFIIGGYNESQQVISSVETFKILPYEFRSDETYPLNYARKECMAVTFNDSVWVFGGLDADNHVVKQIEVMDFKSVTIVHDNNTALQKNFKLYHNYPNPFNSSTRISFELEQTDDVKMEIFNINGQPIKTILHKTLTPGFYEVNWDGTDLNGNPVSSDIYICRLKTTQNQKTIKLLLLK